jgi:uncharacterized membrane protein
MSEIIIGLGLAFVYMGGLLFAFGYGLKRGNARGFSAGKAFGWQECFFEQLARERARRDKWGRFKAQAQTHGGRS